ncbi:MAG: SPOR domain-containing protein [Balneolaceae bacterium]
MNPRRYIPYLPLVLILFAISCGPSQEEIQQQQEAEQQARLDSLERVWEEEMEQMRQDSLAQAEQDRLEQEAAEAEEEEEESDRSEQLEITWQTNGAFTVQVRSWRSEDRAEEHANHWKERGYPHAYIVKHGDESVGDVWFRVRLGNVGSYAMAKRLQEKIRSEHGADSWIANSDAS